MSAGRRLKAWPAALLASALGLGGGAHAAPETKQEQIPFDDLRVFAEVFGRIKSDYVEKVPDKKLLEQGIRGMLSGLDPHSSYLNEDEYREIKVGTSGEFGGLGIEVGMEDGFLKVIAPIDDTPAARAGIKSGDLVMKLDDKNVKGMSLDESVKLMRGKPGTSITLTIMREGRDKPFDVTLERAVIKVASVKSRMLEPGYGYVRLSQFQAHTAEDLLKAVSALKKQAGGRLKGLVLDLRNNPGGVLNAAVAVSDAFLKGGLIVYTEGRVKDSQLKFEASPDDVVEGTPMVVLVNAGSASASEIVAGALQDQKRALIMGRPTFGKGSVQTIIPISERTALKLTTAQYFTPSGRSIQAEGIKPDIELATVKVAKSEDGDTRVREAELSGHLANPNGKSGKSPRKEKDKDKDKEKEARPLAEEDYELGEALNLLKGLSIIQSQKTG
jgi:carboxyl-terminal processing protease